MSTQSPITWIDAAKLGNLARGVALAKAKPQREAHGSNVKLIRSLGSAIPAGGPGILGGSIPQQEAPEAELPFSVFIAPSLALGQRLNSLMDWLTRAVNCSRVFLADADGLPLAQRNATVDMIGLAAVLSDASRQLAKHLNTQRSNSIHVDLVKGEAFHLIEMTCSPHVVALGLQTRSEISAPAIEQVCNAVKDALAEPLAGNPGNSYYSHVQL